MVGGISLQPVAALGMPLLIQLALHLGHACLHLGHACLLLGHA